MSDTPDLLAAIVAASRRVVDVREASVPMADLARAADAASPRAGAFVKALAAGGRVNVIAECKRRSPAKGILRRAYDPAALARDYAEGGAAAISVLTEPTFFDGSLAHLRAVRQAVPLPVLRKDFIVREYQLFEARAAGADAVLLIVGALDDDALATLLHRASALGLAALVEVHDDTELERALAAGARVVGVNARNLRTLEVDHRITARVIDRMPRDVVAVAESGLSTAADIGGLADRGYDAFLIGESLVRATEPGAALTALVAGVRRDPAARPSRPDRTSEPGRAAPADGGDGG